MARMYLTTILMLSACGADDATSKGTQLLADTGDTSLTEPTTDTDTSLTDTDDFTDTATPPVVRASCSLSTNTLRVSCDATLSAPGSAALVLSTQGAPTRVIHSDETLTDHTFT